MSRRSRPGGPQSKVTRKKFSSLLERGRKEGKLEQHEIFELIPDTPANIDVLERLYAEHGR